MPASSSKANAFAYNSWTFPSAGFFRAAYPAIHIFVAGVMICWATPALSGAGESTGCAQLNTPTTKPNAATKGNRILIQMLRYPNHRLAKQANSQFETSAAWELTPLRSTMPNKAMSAGVTP